MNLHLNPHQARVLAALTEKGIATPAYYPMTANGLMAAANQKNSRYPVMSLSEGEVGQALISLESLALVSRDDTSSRSVKWRSKFQHQLLLKSPALGVLITLILRGPQTAAELKTAASSVNGPGDTEGVMAALNDLADRAQPLVKELPRSPGQAATRWAHLLSGEPAIDSEPDAAPSRSSGLEARVTALEQRLAELEAKLASLGA